jgi:sugar phosphate isomerase/epimerase
MQNEVSRREFLKSSMLAAAAVGVAQAPLLAQSRPAGRGGHRWTIACRDAHLKEIGQPDTWSAMKAIGVRGIELDVDRELSCPYVFEGKEKFSLGTPETVKALGERLSANHVRITALCLHTAFDSKPEDVAWTLKAARAAEALRVPAIRIDMAPQRLAGKEDEFLKFCVEAGKQLVRESADMQVKFGVENHGGTTNKPEFMRKLLAGVDADRFGVTLDTANLYWFGHPLSKLYEIYTEFAPKVVHTHCKSIRYPETEREKQRPMGWEYGQYSAPIDKGDIDFKRVAEILRKAGYHGDLCIEDESIGRLAVDQRLQALKAEADLLRTVAGA